MFSLGCVLAFAATGRSPFGEGPGHAVIYRVVHAEPDLAGVPGPLAALVAACLAKDPAARPSPSQILEGLTGPAATAGTAADRGGCRRPSPRSESGTGRASRHCSNLGQRP